MNNKDKDIKNYLLTLILFLVGQLCYSQDTLNFKRYIVTAWSLKPISFSFSMASISSSYSINHYPSKKDSLFYKENLHLITAKPTKENHENYYTMACSLWELGRLMESEKIFLKIMDSQEPYYVKTYSYSSDIPNDTTTNRYGYGSYTPNYKNYACRYLSKIYIEQNKFEQALKYIEYADKKYVVVQNCGTGYMWDRQEIDGLYALAYEGLEKYDSIINMFLPQYSDHSDGILINALKKLYTQTEINEYLKIAEQSIVCVVDTFESSYFIINNYGEEDETQTEIKCTFGTATMSLFGKQVTLPVPNLKNGEKVSKELFVKEFKESHFYTELIDNE